MRHAAWLAAAPERNDVRKPGSPPAPPPKARQTVLREMGRAPHMPPLRMGAFLVDDLWDAGPVLNSSAGCSPLSHSELRAWQKNTGVQLQPWQVSMIKSLSAEYYAELLEARHPDRPAPFVASADIQLLRRARVERNLDAFFD